MAVLAVLARLMPGGVVAGASSVSTSDNRLTAGIIIFAVGIVVGLACVLAMDYLTRKRMERDYRAWISMGRPERRQGERRGKVKKIARDQIDADDKRSSA